MVFSFFGFKKKSVIEDVEAKEPMASAKAVPETATVVVPVADALSISVPAQAQANPMVQPVETTDTTEIQPAVAQEVQAEPEPVAEPQAPGQMDTLKATREDVIAAYKIFLGRLPESMEVVDPRVGVSPAALLVDFLGSKEFLDQTPKAQLVLTVAKKIVEAHRQATSAENTAPNAEVDAKSP